MNAFVAVTDLQWFEFLSSRPELDEVNFWQPSGRQAFRALKPGEPLLFKLHAPNDYVVGGGFFAHFSILPHRTAWEFFGERNGAPSLIAMRERIEKYRRTGSNRFADYSIGCILLTSPFFFLRSEWIPAPTDFAKNIVRGKTYDLSGESGRRLWDEIELRLRGSVVREPAAAAGSLFGPPSLVTPRLGQGSFRAVVTDHYQRRCAATSERALPVLEAAHIRPVSEGGHHEPSNGLLLRADLHKLYDRGYLTVTPDHRIQVSRRLKADFDDGEPYYPLDGQPIRLPSAREALPNARHLEWHADTVFRR